MRESEADADALPDPDQPAARRPARLPVVQIHLQLGVRPDRGRRGAMCGGRLDLGFRFQFLRGTAPGPDAAPNPGGVSIDRLVLELLGGILPGHILVL